MRKLIAKLVLILFTTAQLSGLSLLFPQKLESANLTDVSDTLSNNRLSFRGELDGAVAVGSGVIVLKTSSLGANNTSSGSGSLMGNESIRIGSGSTADVRTVKTIESATRVIVSSGLTTAANDADPVIATVSAVHTVRLTPVSAIPNGAVRVLIPAAATAETGDGLPDKNGFDVTTGSLPTVSCADISGYTFRTGTATASAITVDSVNYHSFECRYSGNGGTGTQIVMTIGTAAGNKIINPSPASTTRYPGQADIYLFRVRHTEGTAGSYAVADESLGRIGVVEAVRVTATVASILTFTMTGVTADSGSYCGISRSSSSPDSTPITVPFGTISTTAFTDAVQLLTVSTNAASGYTVTASESAALTAWNITGTPTIANTTCDSGTCTASDTSASAWTSTANKGFGYALQDVLGDAVSATLEYLPTFDARPFGTTAQAIMSDTAPTNADQAYVCYRAVVSGTQQAGDYENYVIFIATATF